MKRIYKYLLLIISISFFTIFLGGIFNNKIQMMRANTLILIIGFIFFLIFVLFIFYKIKNVKINEKRFVVIYSIFILFLLILSGILLKNTGRSSKVFWDFDILNSFLDSKLNNHILNKNTYDYYTVYKKHKIIF